jgi:hypothetical protein
MLPRAIGKPQSEVAAPVEREVSPYRLVRAINALRVEGAVSLLCQRRVKTAQLWRPKIAHSVIDQ